MSEIRNYLIAEKLSKLQYAVTKPSLFASVFIPANWLGTAFK